MRLLFLHNRSHLHPTAGGGQRITHEIARQAADDGHDVFLPLLGGHDAIVPMLGGREADVEAPYTVVPVPERHSLLLDAARVARTVGRIVRDADIEAIHTSAPEAGLVPSVLPTWIGHVATTQHPDPPVLPELRWTTSPLSTARDLRRYRSFFLEARHLRAAHQVCVPSTWSREMVKDRGYVDRARPVEVVPNGVGPLWFEAKRADRPPEFDLLLVGRLDHQKGVDTLIRALGSPGLDRVTACVVGGGRAEPAYRKLAGELGIGDRLLLAGVRSHEEVRNLMARSSVFVLPTRSESFGMAILEAMAAGMPVVTTGVGGVPDFAVSGHNALLVPPDDPSALGAAIVRLLANPVLQNRLGAAAKRDAERYRWTTISREYVGLMERAAREARGTA